VAQLVVSHGHLLTTLTSGHTSLVSEALFNRAGLLFTASVDGSLRRWDPHAAETDVSGSLTDDLTLTTAR